MPAPSLQTEPTSRPMKGPDVTPPPETLWAEASITVDRESQDAVTELFFSIGALGVTELVDDPCFDVGDGRRIRPSAGAHTTLKALFDYEELDTLDLRVRSVLQPVVSAEAVKTLITSMLEDRDWTEKWKDGFHAMEITPRLALCPSWETYEAKPGQVVVNLDPGMAFGTGTHETTRTCLRLIDTFLASATSPTDLLDVGTGSGVLSIAALLLGANSAWGVDLDPLAVEATATNADSNNVAARLRVDETPIEGIQDTFSLVVANILAGPLMELAEPIAGRVAKGGTLILSGLLIGQAQEVAESYIALGLTLEEVAPDGDWASLLLTRQA